MNIPHSLREATINHKLALFIGSGISSTATNQNQEHPPSWPELLKELLPLIETKSSNDAKHLIDQNQLLKAAELIRFEIEKTNNHNQFRQKLSELVNGKPCNPFRPSMWHDLIATLNPQIIITTNYDNLLEGGNRDEAYKIATFSSKTFDNFLRTGTTIILKIHGDANKFYNDDEDIILSSSDYSRVRNSGRLAFDVLRAVFLTHTTLFLGYSMNDPDLQIILEDLFFDRKVESPHFLLTDSAEPYMINNFKNCYGIRVLEFDDYGLDFFQTLVEEYQSSEALPLLSSSS